MALIINLPNGNRHVTKRAHASTWIERYASDGTYEGVVLQASDLCLPEPHHA